MKIKTHNAFGIGILSVLGMFLTAPLNALISAAILTVLTNQLIDGLGHAKNAQGYPVRTPFTHTIFRSIFWGLAPAILLFLIFNSLRHTQVFHITGYPYWILIQGALAGPLHMFLDAITEGGIFRKVNGKFKRFALFHIRYDNPMWNMFFQFIGIILIGIFFYWGYFKGKI